MYMNMRDFPIPHLTTYKSKGTVVVRKDMNVYEHERLSNTTLNHL